MIQAAAQKIMWSYAADLESNKGFRNRMCNADTFSRRRPSTQLID